MFNGIKKEGVVDLYVFVVTFLLEKIVVGFLIFLVDKLKFRERYKNIF